MKWKNLLKKDLGVFYSFAETLLQSVVASLINYDNVRRVGSVGCVQCGVQAAGSRGWLVGSHESHHCIDLRLRGCQLCPV